MPPPAAESAESLRDLVAESRDAVKAVEQTARTLERAVDRVPTADALAAAWWAGVATGVTAMLLAVAFIGAIRRGFRR